MDFPGNSRYVLMVLVAALLFGAGMQYSRISGSPHVSVAPAGQTTANVVPSAGPAAEEYIYVHVAGAVLKSGVYRLAQGCRVGDAVEKAGPLPQADLDKLNLAAPLSDGQKITVPLQGEPGYVDIAGANSGPKQSAKININTATLSELQELPGIGPSLAQRILDYRLQHGSFASIEGLLDVSGIGPKKLEQIRQLVTVY